MNVLVVHNTYREPGGEDQVVRLESALLARRGHTVVPYAADNHEIATESAGLALAARTIWNSSTYRQVRARIAAEGINLVHVHNTLPLISPAVYYAARAEGVPVVQTVHNYRLICPGSVCVRDGSTCTSCVGAAVPWQAVKHSCYRGSRAATAAVAAMLTVHRAAGTWRRMVDTYIAPTEFARRMLISGGLPANRLVVKPHFVDPDPGVGRGAGGYALYVGRLSKEKGVEVLLDTWRAIDGRIRLIIVGDGPLAPEVARASAERTSITWLGRRPHAEVQRLIADATFLVSPSVAFETFGQVIVEAYAAGTPVVASGGGAAADLVEHGRTGLLARRGDPSDLACQVRRLLEHPSVRRPMREAARAKYEATFSADANYRFLRAIYDRALEGAAGQTLLPQPHAAVSKVA